ncbi:MAG TPA: DNA cytosine methyltransferase, partial [Myxococcota bacterium]
MKAVDLFAGAGGLSTGLECAGFDVTDAYEMSGHACATHRAAHPGTCVHEGKLTGAERLPEGLDLLCGGPPCQPFSGAGLKLGEHDPRDGYPIVLQLLLTHAPRAVLIENVKGILADRARPYFERVILALRSRGYHVDWRCLQAADYGVPQRRERVFIVGFREEDAAARWLWPEPTHSLEALVEAKYIAGGFDEEGATRFEKAALRVLRKKAPRVGTKARARWEAAQAARQRLPWLTVRNALGDLVSGWEPGATLHTPPVPGHLDAHLVDEGIGGHYEGGSRAKSLLYKKMRPDVPAPT